LALNGAFDGLEGVRLDARQARSRSCRSRSTRRRDGNGLAKAKKEAYLAEFERAAPAPGVRLLAGN
jgi:hypothetical protein